ncbi:hypothetical protein V2G26_006866 [Clonostachys chloroleuca]
MEFIWTSRVVLVLALSILVANTSLVTASSDEPWSKYIHSPASRNVSPVGVHSIEGNASVRNCSSGRQVIRLQAGSRISLDFGVEVGGHVSFNARSASPSPLSLAYAESPSFVREISDDTGATPGMDWDQAYNITLGDGHAERAVWYHTPRERFRGGFASSLSTRSRTWSCST